MLKTKWIFCTLLALTLWAAPAVAADKISVMLDWYPNPDHAPIYLAQCEGFFAAEGLDVEIMVPGDPNDPLKLAAAGKVDLAVSYQPSVIMARDEGLPVVSIGVLVQHPLSSIVYLKDSGIKTMADLKGKKIGYSVEPLYRVLFEAAAENAGLKKSDYELYRVGFNLTPPLLSGQIDAAVGAFRNFEAVQVELEGKSAGIFALEENGVPDFYELVLITGDGNIKNRPEMLQRFMRALSKGIAMTTDKPKESLGMFLKMLPDLADELNRRAFAATVPFFRGSPAQEAARWEALQDFMLARGLIRKKTPVQEMVWKAD